MEKWPKEVFSEEENPNCPKEEGPCKTGYLKNIDIKVKDSWLKEFLSSNKCKVLEVKKLFHRHSGKHMPIRRITFAFNSDLTTAIKVDYIM